MGKYINYSNYWSFKCYWFFAFFVFLGIRANSQTFSPSHYRTNVGSVVDLADERLVELNAKVNIVLHPSYIEIDDLVYVYDLVIYESYENEITEALYTIKANTMIIHVVWECGNITKVTLIDTVNTEFINKQIKCL